MPPAHPSSRPCGRNPRRRRARPAASDRLRWTDAEPLSCVAQPGKRIVAVELPGTRRARVVREVVREVVRCIRPIARAGSTACGFRPSLVDGRGAFVVRRAAGKGIVAVEPPGTRRARVVRCIRPIARAASTASGRSQWTDAKPFRELRSRKSEGYARRCFASPAHPSSCPCGRNPRRRMRFAASGRHQWTDAEPLPCVAQPGKRIVAVEPPGTRRARVVREVVRCIRPIARAASTASGRPQWTDAKPFREPRSWKSEGYARRYFTSPAHPSSCPCGRNPWRRARLTASDRHLWTDAEPLSCVAQSGKRIIAVEPPGTRRARVVREVVRCIRPIARAGSAPCGFRPSSMDGRGAFVVRRAVGEENHRSGTARSAPGASGTLHPSDCPGGERGLRLQAVIGGRRRSLCRASRGRESEGYARRCFTSLAHPSSRPYGRNPRRRARPAASGRL